MLHHDNERLSLGVSSQTCLHFEWKPVAEFLDRPNLATHSEPDGVSQLNTAIAVDPDSQAQEQLAKDLTGVITGTGAFVNVVSFRDAATEWPNRHERRIFLLELDEPMLPSLMEGLYRTLELENISAKYATFAIRDKDSTVATKTRAIFKALQSMSAGEGVETGFALKGGEVHVCRSFIDGELGNKTSNSTLAGVTSGQAYIFLEHQTFLIAGGWSEIGRTLIRCMPLENMTFDEWNQCVGPKVSGSWILHNLLPSNLAFFILLSSFVGVTGFPGQSSYCAGNSYQDQLAHLRISKGKKAVIITLALWGTMGKWRRTRRSLIGSSRRGATI
ncbi:KR-domain-containing protein [Lentithecium fluviatile CBS 122367]|uniref:KR-domain-containing protein n=1 Tax=Lentithecium fluviatile CBS 122367 TaxID=1168545 RepID=A0A6G1J881_9PLEO|nr:KR-domain-containing protein [Lentithecium fluviatile CBS 122367]